jgi:hypothetical protein
MTNQVNPFIFDKPVSPDHFIGREEVIYNCYQKLAGRARTSIAVSGGMGLGKTSLLHYLAHTAQKEKWGQFYTNLIFIYFSCATIERFTPTHFWQQILRALKQGENNQILHKQIDKLLQQTEISALDFGRLLYLLSQHQLTLVLQLDDFDWLINTKRASREVIIQFLNGLRALLSRPDYTLTAVIVTRPPLTEDCRNFLGPGSPFYNIFFSQPLPLFTTNEINALIKLALTDTGIEFNQADRDFLCRLAGTYPILLQMASFYLFEEYKEASHNSQTYERVTKDFETSSHPYFLCFWNETSPLQQAILNLIILRYLMQYQLQIDLTTGQIDDVFQNYEYELLLLTEDGLIQKTEDSYQIFSDVFAWWIVRKMAIESEAILVNRYRTIKEGPLQYGWQTLKKLASQLTLDYLTQTLRVDSP